MQPIVPMGAIIEQLGYKLVWSAGSCKLYPPDGKSLALTLISTLISRLRSSGEGPRRGRIASDRRKSQWSARGGIIWLSM